MLIVITIIAVVVSAAALLAMCSLLSKKIKSFVIKIAKFQDNAIPTLWNVILVYLQYICIYVCIFAHTLAKIAV